MTHLCAITSQESSLNEVTCWEAIKKKIDDYVTVSAHNPRGLYYFRSEVEIQKEKRRQLSAGYLVIHPFSRFKMWYDVYRIILYMAVLISKPMEYGFPNRWTYFSSGYFLYTTITNVLCWIDIGINLVTGYVKDFETIELRRSETKHHYMHGPYFICDTLSSIPKFIVYAVTQSKSRLKFWTGILNLLCLLKFVRISSVLTCIEKVSHYRHTKKDPVFLRQTLIVVFILCHWLACLQYGVPKFLRVNLLQNHQNDTWFARFGVDKKGLVGQYVHSFFKSSAYILGVRLTKLYEEKLPEEFVMGVFTYFVGKILVVLVWIVFAVTILNSRSVEIKFAEVINQLDEYMSKKQLPIKLRERLSHYYQFKYQKKYLNEENTTNYLSNNLKREVNLHACSSLIQSVSLFATLNTDELSKVIYYLVPEMFLPNDVIIQSGTYGDAMYFLSNGTVAVYTPSGREICHLQDGAYFGEISLLLKGQTRTTTVVAIEITQVYRLDRKNFNRCLLANKKVLDKLSQQARYRLQETTRLEDQYKKMQFEQAYLKRETMEMDK